MFRHLNQFIIPPVIILPSRKTRKTSSTTMTVPMTTKVVLVFLLTR